MSGDPVTRTLRVTNSQGLHARPCHAVVSKALEFESEVRITFESREVNAKSILELMTLSAGFGSELRLVARGTDAEACADGIAELFAAGFGE